jgi:hypothetical protein
MRNIYFKGYKRERSENKRNIQEKLWKEILDKLKYDKD